jgi:hypothetical protein
MIYHNTIIKTRKMQYYNIPQFSFLSANECILNSTSAQWLCTYNKFRLSYTCSIPQSIYCRFISTNAIHLEMHQSHFLLKNNRARMADVTWVQHPTFSLLGQASAAVGVRGGRGQQTARAVNRQQQLRHATAAPRELLQ